ncbi:MAG: hypothetical protein IPH77_14310 [Ignavibacteria bacterium]|nr:hypothetical protein [Ignavibacteria bacterium]
MNRLIRPTGLLDPEIPGKSLKNQIDDLVNEIRIRKRERERVLVKYTTQKG